MPSNTMYNPDRMVDLQASMLQGFGQGVRAVCTALATTNLDLTLTDDVIITGLTIVISGASLGDYADLKVMSGASTLATPITNWYMPVSGVIDYNLLFPLKLVSGLTIRVSYTATVILVAPVLAVNYKLWKIIA